VITRSGASLDGISFAADDGTLGTQLARVSAGRRFGSGADLAVSGTFENRGGVGHLYFPAFDSPETNNGIAENLDGERVGQFYTRFHYNDFTFTGAYGQRRRDVPTASFGTVFNEQTNPEQTTDRHALADVEYAHAIGATHVTVRGSFDQFSYDGTYPQPGADGDVSVGDNSVLGNRWSIGAHVTRAWRHRQTLTAGAEFIDNLHQDQKSDYLGFETRRNSLQQAAYLQDEIKLTRWLIANGGLRFDHYEDFQRVTPRAALIVMPSSTQSFKYLYGGAFRAPNAYELNGFYFGDRTRDLRPESIGTHELVWERYTNDWLRTSVSSYWYHADNLITVVPDASTFFGTTFVNEGRVHARGLELEAQMRLKGGLQSLVSYALQHAENVDTGATLVNSPAQMAKARLSVPGPWSGSFLSVELLSLGSRQTIAGNTLDPAATASVTLVAPIRHSLELVGSIRNMFDVQYADPASENHRQDSIPQDGRTMRIGLRWTLGK
jgi:iron complex outermembrane receptor protein